MIISTKGRYALRIMLDLAAHPDDGYISVKTISTRQNISMKYLEAIVSMLTKADLLDSMRGKDGGYKLSRAPKDYNIAQIIKLTEGSLAPVACLECGENTCERASDCLTLPLWENLEHLIEQYLGSVSLEDVMLGKVKPLDKNSLA